MEAKAFEDAAKVKNTMRREQLITFTEVNHRETIEEQGKKKLFSRKSRCIIFK
jgi:hypothetical protein